jgi:alkylation response protein AidB-like acyl-CoA dehydrogenase
VVEAMRVFGGDDAPHGHMHLRFTDCRVPAANMLPGEGRGFEISQLYLGPFAGFMLADLGANVGSRTRGSVCGIRKSHQQGSHL